jgi:hypothetical protein
MAAFPTTAVKTAFPETTTVGSVSRRVVSQYATYRSQSSHDRFGVVKAASQEEEPDHQPGFVNIQPVVQEEIALQWFRHVVQLVP